MDVTLYPLDGVPILATVPASRTYPKVVQINGSTEDEMPRLFLLREVKATGMYDEVAVVQATPVREGGG